MDVRSMSPRDRGQRPRVAQGLIDLPYRVKSERIGVISKREMRSEGVLLSEILDD